MTDFPNKHRNLVPHRVKIYPHQKDFFEVLKLQEKNISDFIRVAIDREIEREKNKPQ